MTQLTLISIAILFLGLRVGLFAQDVQKPVIVDEFGGLPCDDMLGRVDAFAEDLKRNPTTRAAIVIYRPKLQPSQAESRRRLISSTLQLRGIAKTRFDFFLSVESEDEIRTALWKIPVGAATPLDRSKLWNEPPPDISRTFMFDYEDYIGECPTYIPAAFAKLILENPGSLGRIVVRGRDRRINLLGFANQFIDDLVQKHHVPRSRLRLILRRGAEKMTAAEFWFVPAKKK